MSKFNSKNRISSRSEAYTAGYDDCSRASWNPWASDSHDRQVSADYCQGHEDWKKDHPHVTVLYDENEYHLQLAEKAEEDSRVIPYDCSDSDERSWRSVGE